MPTKTTNPAEALERRSIPVPESGCHLWLGCVHPERRAHWFIGNSRKSWSGLSDEDIRAIRSNGLTNKDNALRYGLRRGTIWSIKVGKSWRHI